jgi:catechol 2,3-dioxygenase-like lactoylglutathione lyase family enzyme
VSEHARATSIARTYGLTHIALAVRDPERAARFYGQALGPVVVYRSAGSRSKHREAETLLVFQTDPDAAGKAGGTRTSGSASSAPEEIALAVEAVERAGGTILQRGEFSLGEPFVFFADPPTPSEPGRILDLTRRVAGRIGSIEKAPLPGLFP